MHLPLMTTMKRMLSLVATKSEQEIILRKNMETSTKKMIDHCTIVTKETDPKPVRSAYLLLEPMLLLLIQNHATF